MACSPRSSLTRLQRDLLEGFFRRETRFFLTGGAALAGYHLGHRSTQDLDLFSTTDRLDEGVAVLREAARELGATVEPLQTSPGFRRFLVRRQEETVVVDLVYDPTPQGDEAKELHGAVRVDPPGEILANKLCSVLARAEIRDVVDVLALERVGYSIEDALPLAARKDAGLTPGQLAWVLSQIQLGPDAQIPGGVTVAELRDYIQSLQERLTRWAFPKT